VTAQDLIEVLEGLNPDSEVLLAMQPAWPFEYSIGNIIEYPEAPQGDDATKIYIGEGQQLGYLAEEVATRIFH